MNWKWYDGKLSYENESGESLAEADFSPCGNNLINISHVYVSPTLRGKGIAGKVMEEMTYYLRKNSLKATATCSYAASWFRRNEDLCKDILAPSSSSPSPSCSIYGKH